MEMQIIKPETEKNEFLLQLLFLYELINTFTTNLSIKSPSFYSKISKFLKYSPALNKLSYNEKGILYFEHLLKEHRQYGKYGYVLSFDESPIKNSANRVISQV